MRKTRSSRSISSSMAMRKASRTVTAFGDAAVESDDRATTATRDDGAARRRARSEIRDSMTHTRARTWKVEAGEREVRVAATPTSSREEVRGSGGSEAKTTDHRSVESFVRPLLPPRCERAHLRPHSHFITSTSHPLHHLRPHTHFITFHLIPTSSHPLHHHPPHTHFITSTSSPSLISTSSPSLISASSPSTSYPLHHHPPHHIHFITFHLIHLGIAPA